MPTIDSKVTVTTAESGATVIGVQQNTHITEEQAYNVGGLTNPYLGLNHFAYKDRAKYAGREQTIDEAVQKLTAPGAKRTVLFVTGASGSGKSSFALAG